MINEFNIRPALTDDWQEIISIYNYYIINSAFNFEYDAYTLQSRLSWFQQFQKQSDYQLLVAHHEDNRILGYAATTPFSLISGYHTSVNISIYCHHKHNKMGLGSKLLQQLIEQCQTTPIHKMYAGITIPNEPSLKLFTKYGFKQVAYFQEVGHKFNRYWDVVWLERSI